MTDLGVIAIVFVAAAVQSMTGFGFGLVAMGLLPLVISELEAIPLVAAVGLIAEAFIAWRLRRRLQWPRMRPLVLGIVLGAPTGLALLGASDPRWIGLVLGAFLVAYAAWSLAFAVVEARTVSDRWGYVVGLVSGVLGGAFNTSGPPLVVWSSLKAWDRDDAISTLQALFLVTGFIAISVHLAAGRITADTGRTVALALPAVALGTRLGARLRDRIDPVGFRRLLLAMLLMVGMVYVTKAVTG